MRRLRDLGIGYITLLDGRGFGYHDKDRLVTAFDAKQAFQGVVIANNSYTRDTAEGVLRSGAADAVGFGRLFIANPDLAERFQHDWPLNDRAPYDHYWNPTLGAEDTSPTRPTMLCVNSNSNSKRKRKRRTSKRSSTRRRTWGDESN
ncbi:hypothetical protein PINS_up024222 [Pythium insidiosum]|nr:hypothetical protein PINS_up024222 [Pythium insidiosum]